MIYILDHYYLVNHKENCLIIESDKNINDIIEICAAIEFLFEDNIGEEFCLDEQCLLKILTQYYGVKDIKHLFSNEELSLIDMPIDGIYEYNNFTCYNQTEVGEAYVIDLYEARESQCGPNYKDIIDKWLPRGNQLNDIKLLLVKEGKE